MVLGPTVNNGGLWWVVLVWIANENTQSQKSLQDSAHGRHVSCASVRANTLSRSDNGLSQWCSVTQCLPSPKEADTNTLMDFMAGDWRGLWKQGGKPKLMYAFRGVALEDSLVQGEDTAGLQRWILSLPHGEEFFFSEYLDIFHLLPQIYSMSSLQPHPPWAVPGPVWIAWSGSHAWWFLLGLDNCEHWQERFEGRRRVKSEYVFSQLPLCDCVPLLKVTGTST